jgi:hypothetical protein
MDRLAFAIQRMRFARVYLLPLVKDIRPDDWYRQPSEGISHIAWQVGHVAVAQYGLALRQVRGPRPEDNALVPESFLTLFGRGSTVNPDRSAYPSPEEIRAVLDRIHDRVPHDLAGMIDDQLDELSTTPHPAFKTKFDALVFCAEHEMVHAGQIGLLRRFLGYAPLR